MFAEGEAAVGKRTSVPVVAQGRPGGSPRSDPCSASSLVICIRGNAVVGTTEHRAATAFTAFSILAWEYLIHVAVGLSLPRYLLRLKLTRMS